LVGIFAVKSVRAIWRFAAKAWLVAAPMVILFLFFVGAPIILAVAHAIVAHISGPEAADTLLMDAMTWTWIAVLVLAPTGLIVYGAVRLAKRFLRERA
jgi:ABC-type sugar transport system permease subunit